MQFYLQRNNMMDKKFSGIARRIETYQAEMIDLQIGLTAIPALSPDNGGDGEWEKARYLSDVLRRLGFGKVREINAPDKRVSAGVRPNIIAGIPGRNKNKTVWILTHMDIVPPGERALWSKDPYKAYVRGGKIYGRGTEDNQQDMVASIFAAKAFLDEGVLPETSIGVALVADEETASGFGLDYLLNSRKNPFRKADVIVVPDAGNKRGDAIEVAEKSILWLRFKIIGKQCHASTPSRGNNAFLAGSYLVVRLNERLPDVFNAADTLYQPPVSTFQPTRKDANVPNINTIPGEDVFYLDCRVLPRYSLRTVVDEIKKLMKEVGKSFRVSVKMTPVQYVQAPAATAHDSQVVGALHAAVKTVYGIRASVVGVGAGTVAAYFRRKGYPVAVWSRTLQTAHQPDEHCLIKNMVGDAKVFANLCIQEYGSTPAPPSKG
jgi:succinyl-diaminopimelate desuccinylase